MNKTSKHSLKFVAVIAACVVPFALTACQKPNGNDGNYGSLDEFYRDFFDDWDDVGTGDAPVTDPSVLDSYEQTDDYYDATVYKTYNPEYGTHIYEAEWSEFSSPQADKPRRGATQTASGGFVLNYIRSDSHIVFKVNSAVDCTALFKMSLAVQSGKFASTLFSVSYTPAGNEKIDIPVDSIRIGGNGWDDYRENVISELNLKAGENVIELNTITEFNLDYILLVPKKDEVKIRPVGTVQSPANELVNLYGAYNTADYLDGALDAYDPAFGPHIYEAEKAMLSGKNINVGNNSNASAGKIVERFRDGAHVVFAIESARAGTALVKAAVTSNKQFNTSSVDKLVKARFNGELIKNSAETFAGTDDWGNKPKENIIGEVTVKEGLNIFDIQSLGKADENTVFNLDYIVLIPRKSDIGNIELVPDEYEVLPSDWEAVYGRYKKDEYVDGFNTVGGGITIFDPKNGAHIYEAEKANLSAGLVESNKIGASGGKTVTGFGVEKRIVAFEIKSNSDYTALLSVFASSVPNKPANEFIEIKYNTKNLAKSTVAKLVSDKESYVAEIRLKKGDNKLEFAVYGASEEFAVDYITLSPRQADVVDDSPIFDLPASELRIEAESCKLINAKQDGEQNGITSGKVVGNTTPASIVKFKINVAEDCTAKLSFRAAYKDEDANRKVDGVDYSKLENRIKICVGANVYRPQADLSFELPPNTSWYKHYKTHGLGDISLVAGENTVTLYFLAGCMNIDYFDFEIIG